MQKPVQMDTWDHSAEGAAHLLVFFTDTYLIFNSLCQHCACFWGGSLRFWAVYVKRA